MVIHLQILHVLFFCHSVFVPFLTNLSVTLHSRHTPTRTDPSNNFNENILELQLSLFYCGNIGDIGNEVVILQYLRVQYTHCMPSSTPVCYQALKKKKNVNEHMESLLEFRYPGSQNLTFAMELRGVMYKLCMCCIHSAVPQVRSHEGNERLQRMNKCEHDKSTV